MPGKIRSLITSDPENGVALANQMTSGLLSHWEERAARLRPGGTNYSSVAPSVAPEIVSSILFYAISVANRGWEHTPPPKREEVSLPTPQATKAATRSKKG